MGETVIHLDGELPIKVLDEKGWAQDAWTDGDGHVCAHQAIRLCAPVPGDAYLIEQVAGRLWGRGPGWNDNGDTTEADVRAWLSAGIDVTDADLAEVFGPNWRAVVDVVRKAAALTGDQVERLDAARDAAGDQVERLDAAWDAAGDAAGDAAWDAAGDAAGDAARAAARDAAWDAAWGSVVWDLATADGPFTYEHRDLLIAPWEQVFGLPEGLKR